MIFNNCENLVIALYRLPKKFLCNDTEYRINTNKLPLKR